LRSRGLCALIAYAPARVLAGDPRLTLFGLRRQRALPTTHAVHGDCPVDDAGSMAATRMLTFALDGMPSSVNRALVHAMGTEIVAALVGSVACCTTNPCVAIPVAHFATTSPWTLPGLTARFAGAGSGPRGARVTTSRLNPFTMSAEPPQSTVTLARTGFFDAIQSRRAPNC